MHNCILPICCIMQESLTYDFKAILSLYYIIYIFINIENHMAYDIFFSDPLIGLKYFSLNLMVLEHFRKMHLSYKKNLSVQ